MSEIRVALIDDHAIVRQGLRAMIDREPDLRVVGEAPSAATAEVHRVGDCVTPRRAHAAVIEGHRVAVAL